MLVLEEEEVNLLETCLTMRAFVGSNPGRLVICAISELFLLLVASAMFEGPPLAPLGSFALLVDERNRTLVAGDSAVGSGYEECVRRVKEGITAKRTGLRIRKLNPRNYGWCVGF